MNIQKGKLVFDSSPHTRANICIYTRKLYNKAYLKYKFDFYTICNLISAHAIISKYWTLNGLLILHGSLLEILILIASASRDGSGESY